MDHDIKFRNGPVFITEGNGSEPYHMHRNAQELIWVLEGQAGITFNNVEYLMDAENDLILIVDEDFHKVRKISSSLRYISFYIDLPFFQRYIKDILHVGLYVNPGYRPPGQLPYLKKMRILLSRIIREYETHRDLQKVVALTSSLLFLIRNHFNFLGTTTIDYEDRHTFDRLFGVYDFVYRHYTERVGLADLADYVHVSQAYLSRSIKQITGMGFIDILNYVRCEEALRQLLGTDKSITSIAYDCGFSDPKYFHRYFDKFFHANPVEFRQKHRAEISHYTLRDYQKKINLDEDLCRILERYLEEAEPFEEPAGRISFEGKHGGTREQTELTVLLAMEDLSRSDGLGGLLRNLEEDFGTVRIRQRQGAEERQANRAGSAFFSMALESAVQTAKVNFFAEKGRWNGLFTEQGIKTPLYHALVPWLQAQGSREYGKGWAACRARCGDKSTATLLLWNEKENQDKEFQIDFPEKTTEYLILAYRFSEESLSMAAEILCRLKDDRVKAEMERAAADLCRPVCTCRKITSGEEDFSLKTEPGGAAVIIITEV